MTKFKFTATAPDGSVHTRTTETKAYLYAVLVDGATEHTPCHFAGHDAEGNAVYTRAEGWGSWGFSTSAANAEKMARVPRRLYGSVVVVPVDNPRPDLTDKAAR